MSDAKPETPVEASAETKPATATPIFGSASTFGTASGFGGFSGVASSGAPPAVTSTATGEEGEEEATGEEDCSAEFKPIVQLEEVETKSGEEEEKALFDAKAKLYRFDNENSEWKERGIGQARLLEHAQNKRIRFLFRQEKTLKIRGNHVVMPGTKVQEHGGSDKSMVWSCVDFSEEVQRMELFCIRFASAERAQQFKKSYEDAADTMEKVLGDALKESPDADADADAAEPAAEPAVETPADAADALAETLGAATVADGGEEKTA